MTSVTAPKPKSNSEKTKIKTPYAKFRDAAKQNSKTKHSSGAVQVRLGVMGFGILLAVLVYFYPRLFNETVPGKGTITANYYSHVMSN
jgi:hypothetical protein